MIRQVTTILGIITVLLVAAMVICIVLGITVDWPWFFGAGVALVLAAVTGGMTVTGIWITALVELDA